MTLTSHGHHILGTTIDDEPKQRVQGRCEGPGKCLTCTTDELKAFDTAKL